MPALPIVPLTRVPFQRGDSPFPQPLQPPGTPYDGTRSEDGSALFAALQQITTITLGGSTATDDVTTLTITPVRAQFGSAWAEQLAPIVVSFTTGATETVAAVAAGLYAALVAAQTVSSLADYANYQRVNDIVIPSYTALSVDLGLTARDAGGTFAYSITSTGSVTASGVTANENPSELEIGVVAVTASTLPTGEIKAGKVLASSVEADILGVVMEGLGKAPSVAGYLLHHFASGSDIPYRRYGTCTAYAEKGVAVGSQVYVRRPTTGKITGALTDTPELDDAQVITITPTPANTTVFSAQIRVLDFWTGALVETGLITMTSDADALASEIVTGLTTSLEDSNNQLDSYITASGTDTLILTQTAGYVLEVVQAGPGVLGIVETTPASALHMRYPGAKFERSTAAAGSCAIRVAHP